MIKKHLLEFACEQTYVLRFFTTKDGALVLRGNGDSADALVIEHPPDKVKLTFEIDTAALTARVYTTDELSSSSPPSTSSGGRRRGRRAAHLVTTSGSSAPMPSVHAEATVTNPTT